MKKRVHAWEIVQGAVSLTKDLPSILPKLSKMALVRPESRFSLGAFFEKQASRFPQTPCVISDFGNYTYEELNLAANRMARALLRHELTEDDSVAIFAGNHPDVIVAVIACAKAGVPAALINHNQRDEVLVHSFGLVRPKLVLVAGEMYPQLEKSFANMGKAETIPTCYRLYGEADSQLKDFQSLCEGEASSNLATTNQIRANQACFYIFTSGTTGLPKASIMSHYRWLQAMSGMGAVVRLKEGEAFYCCLPLYHNNALTVSLGVTLGSGGTFALDEKFSASRFWQRIRHFDAKAFCYIGELLRYLLNQPQSFDDQNHDVRMITGNGLRPEIWSEFEARFGIEQIYEFYGASESNLGFMNSFGLKETVGFTPIPFQVVACDPDSEEPIRNKRGFMKKVAVGEVGLLISEVTRRRPFDGYTDTSANEKKLLRDCFSSGDLWFNSGDLVRRQGFQHIQFVDRLGDTFRWKGENVATSEVEAVAGQLAWIEHAVVYGVKVEGADGRAGMIAITPKAELNLDELLQHLTHKLPAYAVPLFVRITSNVDTTGTFKYQKVKLKKEGYDITAVDDPLFALSKELGRYVPLN